MQILFNIIIPLLLLIFLIIFSGFFASSETAYTSLTRIQVRQLLKDGKKSSKRVAKLKSNMDQFITTVLTGTNFINTLLPSLVTAFTIKNFGSQYVTYATAATTAIVIMFCEIIPKTFAAENAAYVARQNSALLIFIKKLLFPVVWFFTQVTRFIQFIENIIWKEKQPLVTEEELKTLLEVGEKEGTLEEEEKNMLERIFEFSDLQVSNILKHRSFVVSIDIHSDYQEVQEKFALSGFSRLPVYEDSAENIVGVLNYKSVLFASKAVLESKDFVKICMAEVLFVPETLTAIELLQKFKKERSYFAVVLDEYSSFSGIVTMDDLLREVFGRSSDERESREVSPEKRIKILNTNEFLVPGDMKLDDLNEVLNVDLNSDEYETLGGWLLEHFGELPSTGMVYRYNGIVFVIEDQAMRRIQSVKIIFS